ncbi:MAG: alpha-2-macroglobulin family protein [Sphingobacteriales bacterium]|nr:MAG: alpha-2-macroglobulin family protein [Sphingobacteriales bacterium]
MRKTAGYHFFLICCLLICACRSSKNQLQISSTSFQQEVALQENLTFSFNKDIYPDSLLNKWDSTAYLSFEPSVKGMFKWNSSSELMFSPDKGFLPGTDYTVKVTNKILHKSKKKYSIGDSTVFHFHTAPLRVVSANAMWTRGQNMANVLVQLDVQFNYDVKITDAASHIRLSANGNNVLTTVTNNGVGNTVSLQFAPLNELDKETPVKVEITKGIPTTLGNYTSAKDTSFTTSIPSRFNLSVTDVTAQHSGTEGTITVNTSQPIVEESLKNNVSLEPSVPFNIEATDGGFMITSNSLKADQTYELNISTQVEGIFGGKMKADYSGQVLFGKLDPAISFNNAKGMYLSSQGYKNIALNIVNVPNVEVTVIKVYENNMEFFLRRDKRYRYDYEYDEESDSEDGGSYYAYDTEDMGDTVFHQSYETKKLPKNNSARLLHLDFQDKIQDHNGVYVVCVGSKDHRWVQDSKILSISDIGLIAKQEKNTMYVFANSIHTANPLSGVKVSFISTNNQKLYTATTNAQGVAIFKDIDKQSPGFRIGLVTAKMDDEFSFLWLNQSAVATSRFDVGGRMPNGAGLNAMIYAERNLYRPGETIHVSTIVRDEQWNRPGEMPVKLKLVMPNGKEFATMRKILNEEGSCETSFNMPATTLTGTYTLQVFTGNDVLLNTYDISIEEFMPDRMKVALKIDKTEYNLGDSVRTEIQADNLFGTPAAERNYECELNISKATFQPKNYDNYSFAITNNFNFSPDLRTGKTNAKGTGNISYALSSDMANVGMLKGNIMATVFDETGRPVHRYENFTVYTQPVFLGIKRFDDYVNTRARMYIGLAAVNKSGTATSATATVTVVKKEWHTVIQQDGNRYRYVSQQENKVVKQQTVSISGANGAYLFTPQLSGEYEIRVSVAGSASYVSSTFYAWGYGDTQYTSFDVNNEGNVDIKPNKDAYKMGEDVDLLFTTPFDGRMLVTVERDRIFKYYFVDVKNKSASLSLKAEEFCIPNVYVTATLFRPMGGSDMPLTVAHGFQSVTVENKSNHIPVAVSMTAQSRSKSKQTITVKTQPGALVTIAAVDEGILQIKNYETPDPYNYFYQKVALTTGSYDIYPFLLPEIKATRSSTGGDGSDESSMRVNPMFVNRVKLVSYWSGIMKADGSGIVRYNIDIPQFSGDLRVMAVAYTNKGFGGADQHMKVVDPVIISTALPRFLSPKDEVVMPVSLSNTTAKEATATIIVQASGPLGVTGSSTQSVKLPANRESRAIFNITAQPVIGAGKVTVTVKALGETFVNETEIGVRPPASLQKMAGSGWTGENSTTNIDIANKFMPSTFRGKLTVGRSPIAQFTRNLSYLVQYPYGCVEQTTAAAFPQLYYGDLVKAISGQETSDLNPAYNVQQAINKLQSMQLTNGSLSYWPSGGSESWWGTVFATHFLLEARKAGYDVNGQTLQRLQNYLKQRLSKKETEILYYNENLKKEIAAKEITYSLYVLALAGQSQPATMNYYKGHLSELSIDSKYMLAAAYTVSGQPTQAKQVLPPAFAGEQSLQSTGGSFYSFVRDEALALNAMLEVDPNNAQVGIMAKQLSEEMKRTPYLNTQENVFAILAMGKIARNVNKTTATATVSANGKAIGNTQGKDLVTDLKVYSNAKMQLQVKGKGGYYYSWETSGITADGSYKQEDSYMKVRRTYLTRTGAEVSNNSFKQNDLVVVRISIESQNNRNIDNVAITDMLPAGFEIENTRLLEMPNMAWIKNASEGDYMDIRDDRINYFTSVSGTPKYFYYMVRAVSPGSYQLGPLQADAMYNGSYHSYNGAGVVKVSDK